jgi:hypothetical protein
MSGYEKRSASSGDQDASRAAPDSPYYSNREAADFLRLSPRTLEKYRVIGGGPPFRKFGSRVFYTLADLEVWAGQRICDSTSDPAWRGRGSPAGRTK